MTDPTNMQKTPPIKPLNMFKAAIQQTWQNMQIIVLLAAFFALFDIALGLPILDEMVEDSANGTDIIIMDESAPTAPNDSLENDDGDITDDDYFGAYRTYMIIANIIISPILLMLLARLAMVGPQYLFSGGWGDGFRRYTHVFWVQIVVVLWLLLVLFFINLVLTVLGLPTMISLAILSVAALHVLLFGGLSISYAAQDRVLPLSKAFNALKSHFLQLFPLAVFPGLILALLTVFVYFTGQWLLLGSSGSLLVYSINGFLMGIVNSVGIFFWYAIMRQLAHHFSHEIEQQIDGDPRNTPWDSPNTK